MTTRERILCAISAVITIPSIYIILRGDFSAINSVLLVHTIILDALTFGLFSYGLWTYRQHKPFAQPVTPQHRKRMIFACFLFGMNVLVTAISVAILPITFPTVAALVLGLSFVVAPVLATVLLNYSFQLNQAFGKAWVKALDFPYLFFAIIGLLRLIANIWQPSDPRSFFNTFGIVFVALALSIRMAKAIFETFFDDWVGAPPTPFKGKR